jgi:hypothetical protein
MRWTRVARGRTRSLRTVKSCGPDAPMLAFKLAGGIPQVTVTTKPGHRLSDSHMWEP